MCGLRADTIVTSGRAEREVRPDRASWSISVAARDHDQREAFNACTAKANELIAALRSEAGSDGEVKTDNVRVTPRYEYELRRFVGFDAVTTVELARARLRASPELHARR